MGNIVKQIPDFDNNQLTFGTASEKVILTNVVPPDHVNDGLSSEFGSSLFIVRRNGNTDLPAGAKRRRMREWGSCTPSTCAQHRHKCMVRFTGSAGAWRAVRELDG